MGLVDRRPVVCCNLAMGFWVPLQYVMCFHTNFTRLHKSPVLLLGSLSCTSVVLQKWGLCYSQSTGLCQIPDVSRHATTAKGFTFCRCAELGPAPLTCANLLFAATTTCSSLTVRSRLYQRQPISASSCFHTNFTRLHKNPVWLLGSLSCTSVDLQKWGLCCSQSTGPCQSPTTRPCAPGRTPVG